MKTSKPNSWIFCVAACVTIAVALSGRLAGQTAAVKVLRWKQWFWHAMERASRAD